MKVVSENKPIIACTLSGLFINSEPWKVAHVLWFEEMAEKLNDPKVKLYAHETPYFPYVDKVMQRIYPKLDSDQRTIKARTLFMESVCNYLKLNPHLVNNEVVDFFIDLKDYFRIALITTNTSKALKDILKTAELESFFDFVETSLENEKDDKRAVFERFIEKHKKPFLYLGGSRKDSFDFCNEQNIASVFVNFEGEQNITGVNSVKNLDELARFIHSFSKSF